MASDQRRRTEEKVAELPELVVKSHKDKLLHIMAYVREYSTLTTYTDTIFLFREKMVDYMLPNQKKVKFQGWTKPRVLTSQSYYRFTNNRGLDSVSNACNFHFSWSDWMCLPKITLLPPELQKREIATDTVEGRYGLAETWLKEDGKVLLDINVLADTTARKWVADFNWFFRKHIDFDKFQIQFDYDNVTGDYLTPVDLTRYSYNIESYGRGHEMFGFNRWNQPYYVCTDATVYVIDHEYLTAGEAKKWINFKQKGDETFIYQPAEAPRLDETVRNLIERVNRIDSVGIRINDNPDIRLSAAKFNLHVKPSAGEIILQVLKSLTGIDQMQRDREAYKKANRWKRYFKPEKKRGGDKKDDL